MPRRDTFIDPGSRVLRLETGVANPIRPDEVRIPKAEQEIRRIMREQNREVDEVMVVTKLELATQAVVMVEVKATRVNIRVQLDVATIIPVETAVRGLLPLLV